VHFVVIDQGAQLHGFDHRRHALPNHTIHNTFLSTLLPLLDGFTLVFLLYMEFTVLYLFLLSIQWRVALLSRYVKIISFFGTLGSTCSLVHTSASTAIWIFANLRETHIS
jgi:hypothetical protein